MGTLTVQTLQAPTSGANANKVIIPSGHTLDASNGLTTPAGHVIQVVGSKFDGQSANVIATTSTSFTDTGLSVTITPTSTSSKILVTICCQLYTSSTAHGDVAIFRGSTEILRSSFNYDAAGGSAGQGSLQILDSPATTSATEYSIYIRSGNSSQTTTHNGSSNSDSHITAMEVAA